MRATQLIVLILLSVVFIGCAWQGREIDTASIKKIENGVTTKSEIIQEFGKPTTATKKPDNEEKLAYIYLFSHVTGTGAACQLLGGKTCTPERANVTKTQVLEIWLDRSTRTVKRHTFRVQ